MLNKWLTKQNLSYCTQDLSLFAQSLTASLSSHYLCMYDTTCLKRVGTKLSFLFFHLQHTAVAAHLVIIHLMNRVDIGC